MKRSLILAVVLFLLSVQAGAAATAPTVSTSPATSVTSSSAILNGSLNPNGAATSWYFDFGTSTSYGSKTTVENAGSGTSVTNVAVPIVGLQANRTYHFRLVATSVGGASQGADQSFSTGNAPSVTTSSASSIGSTTAKLNGSVTPNGQSTTWYFEYGTSTSYGVKTTVRSAGSGSRATNVSETISGLTAGTSYHFRLVASSATGTSYGDDQSFATTGLPAVQTGAAQNLTPTSATVNGTVDPKGQSTSWRFEYGTTTGYGSQTPSQDAGSASGARNVTATLSNLTPSTTYHYRLVASSKDGTSLGTDLTFSTPASVTLAPSVSRVVFGSYVRLAGNVSGGVAGVTVSMLAEPFGATSLTQIATVLTGAGGSWNYLAKPTIQTTYQASANGGTSSTATIGVQPAVSLNLITKARFVSRVFPAGTFTRRTVQLQRLSGTRWVTVARARLNPGAVFPASALPHGLSAIRVALSVNQAGPGYLGGVSRTITYRRG